MGDIAQTLQGQVLALRLEVESGPVAKVVLNGLLALVLLAFTAALASVARDRHAAGQGYLAAAAVAGALGLVAAFMSWRTLRELVIGLRVPVPVVEVSQKAPAKGPLEVRVSQPAPAGARLAVRLVARQTTKTVRRTATRTEGTRFEESWVDALELGTVAAGEPLELRARADATRFPPPKKRAGEDLEWVVHVTVDAPFTPLAVREFVVPFDE